MVKKGIFQLIVDGVLKATWPLNQNSKLTFGSISGFGWMDTFRIYDIR